jgi:putative phage-type endonuclease
MDDLANIIQGTDEWHKARLGRVTASRVCDVVARTKTGWGASRANYMAELIAERLTGVPASSYTNAAMMWGTEREPDARAAYASQTFDDIREVGFVVHPTIGMAGASPDGLVGGDGLIEIKCPNTSTHIDTLLGQTIPAKYETQMLWQMACTGRAWCDFISFDPRLPENMRLFVKRLERDDKRISELEETVCEFLAELGAKVNALRALYEKDAA